MKQPQMVVLTDCYTVLIFVIPEYRVRNLKSSDVGLFVLSNICFCSVTGRELELLEVLNVI